MKFCECVASMATFHYQAYDPSGGKLKGEMDAPDVDSVKRHLLDQQLLVLEIKEQVALPKGLDMFIRRRVSAKELEYLTSELSLLLNAGVRIDKALSIICRSTAGAAQSKLVNHLHDAVRRGESLADAMAEWQAVFNPLYLNLVRLGEATGTLPAIFSRLAEDIKFQSELRQRVSQALVYPGVILFVCVLCILFVFNYIVPQMSGLFDGMPEIPFYTEMLLSSSEWVIRYQWLVIMGIFFASFLLMVGLRDPNKARRIDGLVMRLPGLSKFITLTERIRFNTAIALTLESGVLIDRSLEMAVGSVKNRQLKAGLILAKDRVKKGDSLLSALATSPIYDDVSLSLVEVGEESGELGAVFGEISSRSRREFESSVQRMTSLLEPALILVMGGIVGGVVVVMLLSIVSVNDVGF